LSLYENAPFCKKKIIHSVHHATLTPLICPKSYIIPHLNIKIKHYYYNVNSRNIAKLGRIYKQFVCENGGFAVFLAVWVSGCSACNTKQKQ
jgi:hypothetical protein